VLEDPLLAADLAARGVRRAAEFSWAKTALETVDVYRSVLGLPTDSMQHWMP
jgi:hypothetical protein